MFECKHCGTKNQTGSVHCVNCGKTLDFTYEPETKKVLDEHCFTKDNWPHVIKRTIFALLFTLALAIPAGYLFPFITGTELDAVKGADALKRFKTLSVRAGIQEKFTEKELIHIIKKEMSVNLSTETSDYLSYVPQDLSLHVTDDNCLAIRVFYRTLKGKLPFSCTYKLKFTPEDEKCRITSEGTKMGILPLPEFFAADFKTHMSDLFNSHWNLRMLVTRLKNVSLTENEIVIDVL